LSRDALQPQWSPRGDRIVFQSGRTNGITDLYQRTANGSGQDELLLSSPFTKLATQWSRDGRFIVYMQEDPKTKSDLWVLPVDGSAAGGKPIPFLQTEASELFGQLSPDSRWMAFTSDRTGKREVYVRPFPPGEGEWPISIAGGEEPRWRADGKELLFEAADGKMMSVAINAVPGPKPVFKAGTPVALFDAHMSHGPAGVAYEYDVTADGTRFLINTVVGGPSATPLTDVTNWQAGLKK
jgi:Tol biopolymer transport system component